MLCFNISKKLGVLKVQFFWNINFFLIDVNSGLDKYLLKIDQIHQRRETIEALWWFAFSANFQYNKILLQNLLNGFFHSVLIELIEIRRQNNSNDPLVHYFKSLFGIFK